MTPEERIRIRELNEAVDKRKPVIYTGDWHGDIEYARISEVISRYIGAGKYIHRAVLVNKTGSTLDCPAEDIKIKEDT